MNARYFRLLLIAVALIEMTLCPITATQAQVIVWKKGQQSIADSLGEHAGQAVQPRGWESPKTLKLTPAAEPTPAFKVRFWLPPIERRPGDVKTHVDRVIMMYLQHPQRKELDEEYMQISLSLPDERISQPYLNEAMQPRVRAYLSKQAEVLKQLHYALSLDTVRSDYALRDMRGSDFLSYNLADIQNLRNMARLIQLECQLAVADERYEKALALLRDGYRIAELALRSGDGTIVSQLVSIAIVGLMNSEVEALAQQVGSPNLYWALASLPSEQLFSLRNAFDGEAVGTVNMLFPWGIQQAASSEAEAEKRLGELIEQVKRSVDGGSEDFDPAEYSQRQLMAALAAMVFADRAHQQLNQPQLGNCQAVLEWAQSDFVRLRDDIFKWMLLPVQERVVYEERVDESIGSLGVGVPDSPAKALAGLIIPAVQAADAAVQRSQRHHALLVTLEALRAYAAEHNGELPESLVDLRPLPAWSDPTTGEPFIYRRTNLQHAVLITEKSLGVPNEFHIEMVH